MTTCPRCYEPTDESAIFCDEHSFCEPTTSDMKHVQYEYEASLKVAKSD